MGHRERPGSPGCSEGEKGEDMPVAYADLREFLELLERKQDLVRVKNEVHPERELPALIEKLEMVGRYPTVLFENVAGHPGWRVVGNTLATREKAALALGTTAAAVTRTFYERIQKAIPPRR